MSRKIRVGVVFGGRSGEHEVSINSARSVIENLNPHKYDILPIGITKEGIWHVGLESYKALNADIPPKLLTETSKTETDSNLPTVSNPGPTLPVSIGSTLDVIIPVLHGPTRRRNRPRIIRTVERSLRWCRRIGIRRRDG